MSILNDIQNMEKFGIKKKEKKELNISDKLAIKLIELKLTDHVGEGETEQFYKFIKDLKDSFDLNGYESKKLNKLYEEIKEYGFLIDIPFLEINNLRGFINEYNINNYDYKFKIFLKYKCFEKLEEFLISFYDLDFLRFKHDEILELEEYIKIDDNMGEFTKEILKTLNAKFENKKNMYDNFEKKELKRKKNLLKDLENIFK